MDTKVCKGPCGQDKPLTEYYDSHQGDAVYKFASCKTCCSARTHQHRTRPENKARWAKYAHSANVRRKYHLEPEQYEVMLKEQNYVCAVCEKPNPDGKRLSVDHDHETMQVRGLLCNNCNNGLGRFLENVDLLRAAIAYLERNQLTQSAASCS